MKKTFETEAKFRVTLNDIKKLNMNFNFFKQKNVIYTLEKSFLRIRSENNNTFITFKGEKKENKLNVREEIEFIVDTNIDVVKKLFSSIGFKDYFEYEKLRANFSLNNCILSIDKLPNSEIYLEIEGDEKSVLETIDVLGYSEREIISKNYMEVLKDGLH
jgi:adenylate cyclase class 2